MSPILCSRTIKQRIQSYLFFESEHDIQLPEGALNLFQVFTPPVHTWIPPSNAPAASCWGFSVWMKRFWRAHQIVHNWQKQVVRQLETCKAEISTAEIEGPGYWQARIEPHTNLTSIQPAPLPLVELYNLFDGIAHAFDVSQRLDVWQIRFLLNCWANEDAQHTESLTKLIKNEVSVKLALAGNMPCLKEVWRYSSLSLPTSSILEKLICHANLYGLKCWAAQRGVPPRTLKFQFTVSVPFQWNQHLVNADQLAAFLVPVVQFCSSLEDNLRIGFRFSAGAQTWTKDIPRPIMACLLDICDYQFPGHPRAAKVKFYR